MLVIGRTLAIKFLKIQGLVAMVTAGLMLLFSPIFALSTAVGGMISFLGNLFFVKAAFKHAGASKAGKIVGSFFVAEFGKLLIVVSLFGFVFILTTLAPLGLFIGFIATQAVFWFAPLIFKQPRQVKHA